MKPNSWRQHKLTNTPETIVKGIENSIDKCKQNKMEMRKTFKKTEKIYNRNFTFIKQRGQIKESQHK